MSAALPSLEAVTAMTIAHEHSARGAGLSAPSPAAPVGREDEGQRYFEDKSASELSDKYPAGLHPFGTIKRHSRASNETSSDLSPPGHQGLRKASLIVPECLNAETLRL